MSLKSNFIYLKLHYHVVSFVARLGISTGKADAKTQKEKPLLSITIDDGHADNFDVAYPLLKKTWPVGYGICKYRLH